MGFCPSPLSAPVTVELLNQAVTKDLQSFIGREYGLTTTSLVGSYSERFDYNIKIEGVKL